MKIRNPFRDKTEEEAFAKYKEALQNFQKYKMLKINAQNECIKTRNNLLAFHDLTKNTNSPSVRQMEIGYLNAHIGALKAWRHAQDKLVKAEKNLKNPWIIYWSMTNRPKKR